MAEQIFKKILENIDRYNVYYYYSSEEYLVRTWANKTVAALLRAGDAEETRIEGPAPSIEEAVAAAGMISLFGTKRIVHLPLLDPSAMRDADVDALCDLMKSLENAVLVMSSVFRDMKKPGKKQKQMVEAAQKAGLAVALEAPTERDAEHAAVMHAQELGAQLAEHAAHALVERCGTDMYLLETEVDKLAAASNYGTITPELIEKMATQTIDAKVYELTDLVVAGKQAQALAKLQQLFDLQNTPISITAALAAVFVDLYRIKCAVLSRRSTDAVRKDFGYRGSPYRLRKMEGTAAQYTRSQLEYAIAVLEELDHALKSSGADKTVLLQVALCEIMQKKGARA